MSILSRVKKELAHREMERRKIDRDPFYFVEKYIYIENKENIEETSVIPFILWEEQKRAWKSIEENKKNAIIKARQIGLTWLVLAFCLRKLLKFKGFTVMIMSQTQGYAEDAIGRVEFMLMHLPSWLCQEKDTSRHHNNMNVSDIYLYKKTAKKIVIWHPISNVEGEIRAKSVVSARPSTKSAGRSITADIVVFDEWAFHDFAKTVFLAAYPTINRVGSGKFIGLSTNLRGSFFESIIVNIIKNDFNRIFLSVWTDPGRTKEWYENTKKTLPDSYMQEYPETLEQALSAGKRTAFPEFSNSIHVCKQFDIPKHWVKWASVDNGYNDPFAWYKYAISEDGQVFIYYEYSRDKTDKKQVHYAEQGVEFMDSCLVNKDRVLPDNLLLIDEEEDDKNKLEKLQYIVAGRDAWNTHHRDESGKCLIDYYREGTVKIDGTMNQGVSYSFITPITDRKIGMATMHNYLKPYDIQIKNKSGNLIVVKTAKLQIMENCTHLIKTIPLLVKDKFNSEKVEDDSSIDNPYDSVRYGLISWHNEKSKKETIKESKVREHRRKLMRGSTKQERGIIN